MLQGAAEATYWRYSRVSNLWHRYPHALQLIEKVNDEAGTSDSAATKGGLCITHLDSALFLKSEKHDALLLVVAAAAHTTDSKKEKKQPCCSSLVPSILMTPRYRTSRSLRYLGAVSTNLLSHWESLRFRKGRNKFSPLMTPANFCRLQKRVSTKISRLGFGLPPAALSRKWSRNTAAERVERGSQPSLSLEAKMAYRLGSRALPKT